MEILLFNDSDLCRLEQILLEENQVHIWYINLEKSKNWIESKFSILDWNEKGKVMSFKYEDDRLRCMAGRIFTKVLASQYLKVSEKEFSIEVTEFGKPYLNFKKLSHTHMEYNLSHSGKYLAIAFSYDRFLGIDIQEMEDLPDYCEVAQNCFHNLEYEAIFNSKERGTFYDIWTGKEAYIKAVGKGWLIDSESFYIKDGEIFVESNKAEKWQLVYVCIDEKYSVALVIGKRKL